MVEEENLSSLFETNLTSNSSDGSGKSGSDGTLKPWLIGCFLMELIVSLYIYYRQYAHVDSINDVPEVIRQYDPEPELYTISDIRACRDYTLNKIFIFAGLKIVTILVWLSIILFDLIKFSWDITKYLAPIWPAFFSNEIARNISFVVIIAVFLKLSSILLLMIKSYLAEAPVVDADTSSTDLDYDIGSGLIPVGIAAGFVTLLMSWLDWMSIISEIICWSCFIAICVVSHPMLGIWIMIRQQESNLEAVPNTSESYSNLKAVLSQLCDRVGFSSDQLLLISSENEKTNAFYFGIFGYRRILVLQGSLSEDTRNLELSTEEVEAVVAHELGHWFYSHSLKSLIIWHLTNWSTVLLMHWLRKNETTMKLFGLDVYDYRLNQKTGAGYLPGTIIAYYLLLRYYVMITDWLTQIYEISCEYAADQYAVDLGYRDSLGRALIKIMLEQSITFPSIDVVYNSVHHNHPGICQRLEGMLQQREVASVQSYMKIARVPMNTSPVAKILTTEMGCCGTKVEPEWDTNFKETQLSSNRCDAEWEEVEGAHATFGMAPHFYPAARFGIVRGVIRVKVGFAGGLTEHPTYQIPGDHTLAVDIEYNPETVKFEQLIEIFWSHHDIFLESESNENQSTIFYHSMDEKELAKECLENEQKKHAPQITTMIRPFTTFIPSEDDCQHFLLQSNKDLMKLLSKHLHPHQMAHSHLACKIEGYLAGFGMPGQFMREVPELYLPDDIVKKIEKACDHNQPAELDVENAKDWDKVHSQDRP